MQKYNMLMREAILVGLKSIYNVEKCQLFEMLSTKLHAKSASCNTYDFSVDIIHKRLDTV